MTKEFMAWVLLSAMAMSGCAGVQNKKDLLSKLAEAKTKTEAVRAAACSDEATQKLNEVEAILGIVIGGL